LIIVGSWTITTGENTEAMIFLHTADLHLKKGESKRLEVFAWLLDKADELKVEYFIISGDFFDSDSDATVLRREIRRMCESAKCNFLVIPGNHDARSYGPDYDYGNNVLQMTAQPFQVLDVKDIKICGVPYVDTKFSEIMKDMPRDIDVLIAHGTLYDPSFIFFLLEDEETKYMPVFPADLENTARYVAMGHLHSRSVELKYGKTHVVYPGSPIALDTKCVGERYFYLVSVDCSDLKLEKHGVDKAAFWLVKDFFVYPQVEQGVLDRIEEYLQHIDDPRIMPQITVKGFIGDKEKKFLDALIDIEKRHAAKFDKLIIQPEIQSWDRVMVNPLIRSFVAKTADLKDEVRMKVFEITFPIFSRLLK
jgi:DNA repair exonuclease SbcCD nuclease subunit